MQNLKFKYRCSCKEIPYAWQNYIWCLGKIYPDLPDAMKKTIIEACSEAGREYYSAVFREATTHTSPYIIARDEYISDTALRRITNRYYRAMYRHLRRTYR